MGIFDSRIGELSEILSLSEQSGIATDDSARSTRRQKQRYVRSISDRLQRIWITTTTFTNSPFRVILTRGNSSRTTDDRVFEITLK